MQKNLTFKHAGYHRSKNALIKISFLGEKIRVLLQLQAAVWVQAAKIHSRQQGYSTLSIRWKVLIVVFRICRFQTACLRQSYSLSIRNQWKPKQSPNRLPISVQLTFLFCTLMVYELLLIYTLADIDRNQFFWSQGGEVDITRVSDRLRALVLYRCFVTFLTLAHPVRLSVLYLPTNL